MFTYFVRLGPLAELRAAVGGMRLPRDCRVIVRTSLGLQVGEIVGPCRAAEADAPPRILRATSAADELLVQRLGRHRRLAVQRCRAALAAGGSQSVLLDVEPVLDGTRVVLHFLGTIDEQAERLTAELVAEYESIVRTADFAALLEAGCGPDCGTGAGAPCSNGQCSGCALSCR